MLQTSEKYEKILQAAIEVISAKGLEKTSISEIVKLAGVAQGTFYLYFKSKNALIPAIAENLLTISLEKIKQRISGEEGFWKIIEILIDEIYDITNQYKDVTILCYSGMALEHSLETWENIYAPYYTWFNEILEKAIVHKEIIGTIPVEWTGKVIINMIENAAERFFIGRDQDLQLEQSKKELFQFIQRSLQIR